MRRGCFRFKRAIDRDTVWLLAGSVALSGLGAWAGEWWVAGLFGSLAALMVWAMLDEAWRLGPEADRT